MIQFVPNASTKPRPTSCEISITVLGSGSSGNCTLLTVKGKHYLVDAGLSAKQISLRLAQCGVELGEVAGIFLTHEHIDHSQGLATLVKKWGMPIYANRLTSEAIAGKLPEYSGWKYFRTGETWGMGGFEVESFAVPHDAYDPVGFIFQTDQFRLGFLTDLGFASKLVIDRCRDLDALLLETNYDEDLLRQDAKRPWAIKQRIQSRHGHLSNKAAARVAVDLYSPRLRTIVTCHLSSDCNRIDLAHGEVLSAMESAGMGRIGLVETFQNRISETVSLG